MKYLIFWILALMATTASSQQIDSMAIKQVDSLILVSQDLTEKGDFAQAITISAVAENLAIEKLGMESEAYGKCAHNRGWINHYKEDGPEAVKWYLISIAIREKVGGRDNLSLASTLNNLAILYDDMSDFEKSEQLYLEGIALRKKIQGVEHPDYANILNNLAALYRRTGNYKKSEQFYLESKDIRKKIFGNEHPDYAQSLNNIATLYSEMGNNEKAEQFYLEALTIREKVYGRGHFLCAESLRNLGNVYKELGNYEKAEPLYLEASGIIEKVRGKTHPSYGGSLNNLANLYVRMGNYEKAVPLFLEAKSIWEKALGKEHPYYAASLDNLAILYWNMGNYEKAEPLYLEAKNIREKVLGKEHRQYALSLSNLALLYEIQTRYSDADTLLKESITLSQSSLINAMSFLSEQELDKYVSTFKYKENNISSFLQEREANQVKHGILPNLVYDNALFNKGFLLNAASRLERLASTSPETKEIYLRLKSYQRELAAEYTKPIVEQKGIAELEENANLAEKELARTEARYADAIRQVKWLEVQKALKSDEAAVEFVHFHINFPQSTDSVMYAALLITSDNPQPVFIPLFEEKELINKISRKTASQDDQLLAQLYTRGLVPTGRLGEQDGLYDLCWKPLDSLLAGISTIYYSPSGMLNQINFDAIPIGSDSGGEGLTLADKYALVRLGSTRSIVIPDATPVNPSNETILYGGIQYELDTTSQTLTDSIHQEQFFSSTGFTYALRSVSDRGGDWSYLPGTAQEIAEIKRIGEHVQFPVTLYQGSTATEETVKEIGRGKPSPRILHFATHGFFFPDAESKHEGINLDGAEPVFKLSDNPMIRSGLILAGGNYAWQHGRAVSPEQEDGILTAYEISQMNLANTELVVLSACETGLGDIQGNEGVYGLQRAFKIAGAKYLIMSLWQVPDKETKEFMKTFYRHWLFADAEAMAGKEEKMSIPDAFRKTQRELRDRFFNPYSWAGFVLVE